MPRFELRRLAVALLTGAVASVGAVVLSPAAHAEQVTYTSQCTNVLAPGLPIPPSETKVDISVSPAKPTYRVGEVVTVSWKWGAYSNVPEASPIDYLPENSTLPVGQITLSGAQNGVFTVEGERKNAQTPKGQPLIITDMSAPMLLTAAGTLDLTPKQYSTFTAFGTFDAETQCLPVTSPTKSTSIIVEPGEIPAGPQLVVPSGEVRPGADVALGGTGFAPNATPKVKLCETGGNNCLSSRFTARNLTIDGSGTLAGTAKLAATGLPDGQYLVEVYDGVSVVRAPITIKVFTPVGKPTAVADITTGPVGTVVTIHGDNWRANGGVGIDALDADGFPLLGRISVFATAEGVLPPTQFTVTDPATATIRVRRGTSATEVVRIPFTTIHGQSGQTTSVTLNAGALAMTQAGDGLDFGTVTLNGEAQTVKANLNQVTVTDARGGTLGWSLTGSMTDLVAANGTDKIPAGNLAWTPSCAAGAGSLSTVTHGTAGPLSSAASTLCSVAADGKTSGGRFTADAEVALTTPKFGASGGYTGTLTLTLI
ncbi:hypothetical protein GCM10023205_59820 [Yinghuangia aomiensis]|uniref:IPT/TIG domain-containing protein n=1 Tax=Yinghuangia aomiensis TaxID=676205 RepID=A0ABP9HYK7_9ACTN